MWRFMCILAKLILRMAKSPGNNSTISAEVLGSDGSESHCMAECEGMASFGVVSRSEKRAV